MEKKKGTEIKTIEGKLSRDDALETAMKQIEKDFGQGAIMRLGDAKAAMKVDVIPTGIMPLDAALGVGGLPRGRIIEIFGPESSGKTTVTLHMIAEVQKNGGIAAFIDAEHALDPVYAKHLGVDIDNLLISQPDTGEQALDIVDALIRSGAIDIIVVDSVAALVPQKEIEGDMGDSVVGLQARMMSKAMRKMTGIISKSKTVAVFINQIREKVGIMFGNPETTTGGKALKFYSSVRIDVRKGESIKQGSEIIGYKTKIKVVKNKVAPPFRTANVEMIFGEGVSKLGTILDLAVDYGLVDKSGAWFSYDGQRIGQGKEKAKEYMANHPDVFAEVEAKVRAKILPGEYIAADDANEESSQSMRQIHAKLIRRGFPSELISEAIDELDGCEDREIEAAMKALRHRSWKSGDRQKMKAYLYRKGFSYDVASSAVEAFIDADRERFMEEEEEDD